MKAKKQRYCNFCNKKLLCQKMFCSIQCRIEYKFAHIENLTNKKFGSWTVLSFLKMDKESIWKCKCQCGTIKNQKASILKSGMSKQCKNCKIQKQISTDIIPLHVFSKIVYSANKRKIKINLTIKYITNLLIKQNYKCYYSGQDITVAKTTYDCGHGKSTASLDRIDSGKGYVKNNVCWVHKNINRMKNKFNEDQFILMCEQVYNNVQNNTVFKKS